MNPLAAVTAVAAARAVASIRQAVGGRQQSTGTTPGASSDLTELSGTGRLIEALLGQSPADTTASAAGRPLLAGPPQGPGAQAALTLALQRGMSQSGLFYESHLADWLQGELPLAELAREPQGRLPALPAPADSGSPALPAGPHAQGAASAAALPPAATATGPGTTAALASQAWHQQVDPRAAGIVQQQLLSLDTQVLPWHGEVWPGQAMDWQITPDVDPEQRRAGATPESWSSRLRLELPQLGAVEAELQWSAGACSLRIAVPAARLSTLRAALPQLAQALSDAGVRAERILASAQRETSRHD